jgi:predicted transcriptional regulator
MSQEDNGRKEKKAALKELRAARKEQIVKATARVKVQKKTLKAIKAHLEKGPGTVPEVAAATGIPTNEVLWYLAALKKYGEIVEGEKDGEYFRYALPEKSAASQAETSA